MIQLSIDDAIRQGDEAAAACAAKADRENPPGWQDLAFAWIVKWSMKRFAGDQRHEPFTSEAMVVEIVTDPEFPRSHDDRSFGAPIKRAIGKGVLAYFDSKGKRARGHGSRCDRYLVTGLRPTEIYGGDQ